MRPDRTLPRVYLHRQPVDFRKSINGLAAIVDQSLDLSPFSRELFVFINRKRDRIKILFWEPNGFCLYYKRLEKHRFHWPQQGKGSTLTLTGQQLNALLDGFNVEPHPALHYTSV